MSARHRTGSEREQLELFRALPGDLAPRDAQDLMAYPFFSLAKSHRSTPIDFRSGDVAIRVEDLQMWVDAAAKESTSDPGKAVVLPAKRHTPAQLEQARQPRR